MEKILKILLLVCSLLTSCINLQYPCEKTFQLDYIENGEIKHIFLNVIETENDVYKVTSQEYVEEEPNFVILDFFNYEIAI